MAFFGKDFLFKSDVTASTPTDDCIETTTPSYSPPVFDQWYFSQTTNI